MKEYVYVFLKQCALYYVFIRYFDGLINYRIINY